MLGPVSIIYGRTVPSAACDYEMGTNFLLRYIQAKEKDHKEISAKCTQPRLFTRTSSRAAPGDGDSYIHHPELAPSHHLSFLGSQVAFIGSPSTAERVPPLRLGSHGCFFCGGI